MKFKYVEKTARAYNIRRTLSALTLIFICFAATVFFIDVLGKVLAIILFVVLFASLVDQVSRFFRHQYHIKHQILEVTSSELITIDTKNNEKFTVTKSHFKIGAVKRKNGKVVSIGIRYNYVLWDINLSYYENMDELLKCLQAMK